jgi:ADP-heptose:LPS heptosyltransferase
LWLHAGSGSPAKNVPLAWLAARARAWLAAHPGGRLVTSFGEADLALRAPLAALLAGLPVTELVLPLLTELRARLAAEATAYLGADTGVTHLAATLGIPTEALFVTTDPAVWRPLGPAVRVVRWSLTLDP